MCQMAIRNAIDLSTPGAFVISWGDAGVDTKDPTICCTYPRNLTSRRCNTNNDSGTRQADFPKKLQVCTTYQLRLENISAPFINVWPHQESWRKKSYCIVSENSQLDGGKDLPRDRDQLSTFQPLGLPAQGHLRQYTWNAFETDKVLAIRHLSSRRNYWSYQPE